MNINNQKPRTPTLIKLSRNPLANSSKSDLVYNISLYDKFKDELDLLTIKNKKKDFFNCLEMFYQHNGLNRKDKIEKLLK